MFEKLPFPSGCSDDIPTLHEALDRRISGADVRAHRLMKEGETKESFATFAYEQELFELRRDLWENPSEILWMPENI